MEVSYNTKLPVIEQIGNKVLIATPSDGNKWVAKDAVTIFNKSEEIAGPTGDVLVQNRNTCFSYFI